MSWDSPRHLNTRLAVGLLLTAVLLPVAIQATHYFQVNRSARGMLFRAQKALADGKTQEAIRCFKYYVHYQPDDVAVFSQLALLNADQVQAAGSSPLELGQSYAMLEQAVIREPDNLQLVRRMAEMSFQVGRLGAAAGYLNRLVGLFPDDVGLQLKFARSLLSIGDFRRAAEILEMVVAKTPQDVLAFVDLAGVLRNRLSRPEEANQVVERMVAANPESGRAYLERGRYRWNAGAKELAVDDFARAVTLAPDDLDVLITVSEFHMVQNQLDQAEQLLQRARELKPQDRRVERAWVALKNGRGQTEEALALLQKYVDQYPEDAEALVSLADMQVRQNEIAGTRASVRHMEKLNLLPVYPEYYRARILVMERNWRDAAEIFERLRMIPRKPAVMGRQIQLLLGMCYEQLGQPDRQMEAYERLLASEPNLLAARIGLATALYRAGRNERALEEHLRVLKALGLDQFIKFRQLRTNLYQLLVWHTTRLPTEQRDWSDVERLVDKIREIPDLDPVEASLLQADLMLKRGETAQARQFLAEAEKKHPDNARLHSGLAALAASDDPQQALALLQPAKPSADTVELRLARANVAMRLGAERGAALLLQIEKDAGDLPQEQQIRLFQGLGSVWYQLRNRDHTRRLWEKVAAARPTDLQIRMMLFESAREVGDEAGMLAAVRQIEKAAGTQTAEWRYCEAARLVWQVRHRQADQILLVKAARYAKQAAAMRPRWHSLACLEAEIAVLEERLDEAIEDFRRAAEISTLSQAHLGQYVRLLYVRGRYDEARELINRSGRVGASQSLRMLDSELEMRSGRVDESLELAASVRDSKNPIDQLWYGQFLARAGKNDEAEAAFRRAIGLGPNIPELWLALIGQLNTDGKREQAQEIVRTAQTYVAEDRAPLLLAQGYELLGDQFRAEQNYLAAAAIFPENFSVINQVANFFAKTKRTKRAMQYLQHMLQLGERSRQADRAAMTWARRTLATLMAVDGTYAQQQQALALLQQNAVDDRLGGEDLYAKAKILTAQPLQRSKRAAAETMVAARREGVRLSVEDRVLLARLYHEGERRVQAQAVMRELIAEKPKEGRFLRILLEMMLSYRTPPSSLEPWVARLERLTPEDPFTIACRARILNDSGSSDRAVALLEKLTPSPLDERQAERARLVAETFEQIKQPDRAEKLLRQLAEKVPAAWLDLAKLHGRQQQLSKALDDCQAAEHKVPWDELLSTALAVVDQNRAKVRKADLQRLRQWAEQGLQSSSQGAASDGPDQPGKPSGPVGDSQRHTLQLAQAHVLSLLGEVEASTTAYRALLADKSLSEQAMAVAQNNLAHLMALEQLSKNRDRQPARPEESESAASTGTGSPSAPATKEDGATGKKPTKKADKTPQAAETGQEEGALNTEIQAALALSDKAITVLGPTAQLCDTRGLVLLAAGHVGESIEQFQQALEEHRTGLTFFHLAMAFLAKGSKQAAADALEAASKKHHLQPAELPLLEQPLYHKLVAELKEQDRESPSAPESSGP